MTFKPGDTLTAADLNAALANYVPISALAATAQGQGGSLVGLTSGDTIQSFIAKLLGPSGAGIIGAASGSSVQAFINNLMSSAGAAAIGYGTGTVKTALDAALIAAVANQGQIGLLTTSVNAGGSLPYEVTALSGSFVGTGSGGTPGEYALTVSGGPAGHTAFITVGADGKIASARIGARGIATANTAPTYALPSGTGLTGATLPTPTVSALAAGRIFFAPDASSNATRKLGWQSSGGVIAAWNVGGAQYSEYFSSGVDANFVGAVSIATVNGFSILDSVGNELGFLPADGTNLRLPYIKANTTTAAVGPFSVQQVDGIDGAIFVDPVGNSFPFGGSTSAALDLAKVQKVARLPNSIVTFGHSKTEQNSWGGASNVSNPGGVARKADVGWFAWLDYYLRGSLNWIYNAGIGGQDDTQLLSRVNSDVVAKGAAYCIIQGATCNSINAGLTADQIVALQLGTEGSDSSNSILGLLQAAGMQTIWLTDPTWYTGHPDLTADKFATLCRVNRATLRAQGYKPGLLAIDTAGVMVDPLATTGTAKQYYIQTDDNIHESPLGARVQGKLAADRMIAAGFPLMDILINSVADAYGSSTVSKQLLDNPFMTGTGGTGPGGGVVTGTIPDGWRIAVSTPSTAWAAGSITSTTTLRADGFGYDWVVTVNSSPVAGARVLLIGPDNRSRLTAGDLVQASAQVDITGMSKVNGHEFYSSLYTTSVFPAISTLERDAPTNWSSLFYSQSDLTGGVMRTGKAAVPSGTLQTSSGDLRLVLTFDGAGGTATVRMSRAQYLKNS